MLVTTLAWLLAIVILVSVILSVYNSFRSRRTKEPVRRGLLTARMNINMGIMLIAIALFQFLMYEGSSVGVVVGAVFILLGLFNLFAGWRNRNHFKRLSQS